MYLVEIFMRAPRDHIPTTRCWIASNQVDSCHTNPNPKCQNQTMWMFFIYDTFSVFCTHPWWKLGHGHSFLAALMSICIWLCRRACPGGEDWALPMGGLMAKGHMLKVEYGDITLPHVWNLLLMLRTSRSAFAQNTHSCSKPWPARTSMMW